MTIKDFFGKVHSQGITVVPDPLLAPLFASGSPAPFIYITSGEENARHAETLFLNCGLTTTIIPNGSADVLVLSSDYLGVKVPCLPSNFELKVNGITEIKNFVNLLADFGYERTDKALAVGEYSIRGDIVDVWQINSDTPTRIMFFGDTIEAMKTIDAVTFASIQALEKCEIPPVPALCKVERYETMWEQAKSFSKTVILDRTNEFFKDANIIRINTLPIPNYFCALSVLVPDIIRTVEREKQTALVFVGASRACENYMQSKQVPFVVSTLESVRQGCINIIRKELGVSFALPDEKLAVFSVQKAPTENVNTSDQVIKPGGLHNLPRGKFQMPRVGEVVVHEYHGLGRYLGTKELTFDDAKKEYLVLQYDGGAFVYVPVDQTQILSNYHGEPTRLSRIGGQDFAAAKQRVRQRLRELTFELAELYAKRARAKANKYEIDIVSEQQFANAFPHPLTPDQVKAVSAIDEDMRSGKVMDRLLCGDVGFGKTEVAFRAIFRAVQSGYQCAFLCPTTILSVQHGNTAKARLEPFGFRVEVLNRLQSDKKVAEILKCIESGEVDLVIGTHKLLNPDIRYKNLGLLILDEEQRFGVAHKEQIKQIKLGVDILTLSATPIPRTMHMALLGIRDISTLMTPPTGRLPVITQVVEYSNDLVRDAILREAKRNGQTIILFNDVSRIEHFANNIRIMCEDISVRVGIVHGKLSERVLEDTIIALYNKKIDILISSTIVENGIDLTAANTFIAIDADKLGVAQMHQLRGRVGRGLLQSYAYFTYQPGKYVTEIAATRLEAIQNHASSGGGLQIALKDLEIRGAGDILGAEQSGHIAQVGFDTYCKILAEVVEENQEQ